MVSVPIGVLAELPDLCKGEDGYARIITILASQLGEIPTRECKRSIYNGMSEAYRRGHTKILAAFLYYGWLGAMYFEQPLALHIIEVADDWLYFAREKEYEEGLRRLRSAAVEAEAHC